MSTSEASSSGDICSTFRCCFSRNFLTQILTKLYDQVSMELFVGSNLSASFMLLTMTSWQKSSMLHKPFLFHSPVTPTFPMAHTTYIRQPA